MRTPLLSIRTLTLGWHFLFQMFTFVWINLPPHTHTHTHTHRKKKKKGPTFFLSPSPLSTTLAPASWVTNAMFDLLRGRNVAKKLFVWKQKPNKEEIRQLRFLSVWHFVRRRKRRREKKEDEYKKWLSWPKIDGFRRKLTAKKQRKTWYLRKRNTNFTSGQRKGVLLNLVHVCLSICLRWN